MGEVIDAATECLVQGVDSPSLRELAGASPRESHFVLDELITATVAELSLLELLEGDVQRGALEAMLRKMLAGQITPREVARWAYRQIGYEGGPECDEFVNMDDLYDESEYLGYDEEQLDAWMISDAEALLAGRPLPGPPPHWQQKVGPPPPLSRASRIRGWLSRRR
jgi:hypothetical protein